MLKGVRGATTVAENAQASIDTATQELLRELIKVNSVNVEDIAAIIFSSTPDLNASFAATAARQGLNLEDVPLFGCQEVEVIDAPKMCIRVLLLLNVADPQTKLRPIYLHGASQLRNPD